MFHVSSSIQYDVSLNRPTRRELLLSLSRKCLPIYLRFAPLAYLFPRLDSNPFPRPFHYTVIYTTVSALLTPQSAHILNHLQATQWEQQPMLTNRLSSHRDFQYRQVCAARSKSFGSRFASTMNASSLGRREMKSR